MYRADGSSENPGGGGGETISYVEGIICPLVEIGFNYLPKYISRGLFNLG